MAYSIDGELRPGGTIQVDLVWWLDGPPPHNTDYHAFAHLVDAHEERFGQHDMASFPAGSWQTGDLVLTRFQIQVDAEAPLGEYWIRTGMYGYPYIINVPVVDTAGNPVADAVVIGPVSLQ